MGEILLPISMRRLPPQYFCAEKERPRNYREGINPLSSRQKGFFLHESVPQHKRVREICIIRMSFMGY